MQLEKLTKQVCELAKNVGEFIALERQKFSQEKVEKKGIIGNDLVSYVDFSAERKIIDALSVYLPKAGFITEETHAAYKNGLNWIVDPLDGTTNFVQGITLYCISIALVENSEILLGVVFEVNQKDCYYSWKGAPSFCNEKELLVSKTNEFKNAFIATGFSVKNTERLEKNLAYFKFWIENTRGVRRLGSAALDLCLVAKGVFDVFYETNLSPWDVAAGALIVQNAGGTISDFSGGNNYLFADEIVATNGVFHKKVLEILG